MCIGAIARHADDRAGAGGQFAAYRIRRPGAVYRGGGARLGLRHHRRGDQRHDAVHRRGEAYQEL